MLYEVITQLVEQQEECDMSARELEQAVAELAARRHYLAELSRMGKLDADDNT